MESNNTKGEIKYKYFIEDIDTGLWYRNTILEEPTVHTYGAGHDKPEVTEYWTNDPHQALSVFKDKEDAELWLAELIDKKYFWFQNADYTMKNLKVTEHEFVGNSTICPETKKECVQHPSQCSTVCWEQSRKQTPHLFPPDSIIWLDNLFNEKEVKSPPVPNNYQESPELGSVQKPMDIVYYNMAKQMTQKEFSEWIFKVNDQQRCTPSKEVERGEGDNLDTGLINKAIIDKQEFTAEQYAEGMMGIGEYQEDWHYNDKVMYNNLKRAVLHGLRQSSAPLPEVKGYTLEQMITMCSMLFDGDYIHTLKNRSALNKEIRKLVTHYSTFPDFATPNPSPKGEERGVKREDISVGDEVHYTPFKGAKQNGKIKSITDDGAFVVYNCQGEWDKYILYTGQLTSLSDLSLGWI